MTSCWIVVAFLHTGRLADGHYTDGLMLLSVEHITIKSKQHDKPHDSQSLGIQCMF